MHPPTVGEVMTQHPWVIPEDQPLRAARHRMTEHGVRHLPVVRRDRCVGVLTDRDLKRALNPDLGLPPLDDGRVIGIFTAHDACRILAGYLERDHAARSAG